MIEKLTLDGVRIVLTKPIPLDASAQASAIMSPSLGMLTKDMENDSDLVESFVEATIFLASKTAAFGFETRNTKPLSFMSANSLPDGETTAF